MPDAETSLDGYVSLAVTENALMHREMAQHIENLYGDGGSGSKRLRMAISHFVNRHFDPVCPVKPEHLNVLNGVTTSIEGCAFASGNHGDGFLLGEPYYGSFPRDLGDRAGIKVISVKFGNVDPFGVEAVPKYEDALLLSEKAGTKVKSLILSNPHNPLGRCYSHKTLIAFMRLCQKHRIHLI